MTNMAREAVTKLLIKPANQRAFTRTAEEGVTKDGTGGIEVETEEFPDRASNLADIWARI